MNNPMLEIANTLADLYNQKAKSTVERFRIEKDIERRKLELTPIEGWPGKNAELREVESRRAFTADETLATMDAELDQIAEGQAKLDAHIEGMEAERRALEWQVRCGLVEALTGKAIVFETPGGDVLYTAFDDVLQDAVDDLAFQQGDEWIPEAPNQDELPLDFSEFHETKSQPTYKMLSVESDDEVPF